jgi:hypothetical protein
VSELESNTRPAHLEAGGVYLPAPVCERLWRILRAELLRHRDTGARVRPDMLDTLNALRFAAQSYTQAAMSAVGHEPRTPADIEPPWEQPSEVVTTEQLAIALGVTDRHARRIAKAEGISPVATNAWHRTDVAALATRRRNHR